MKKTILMLLTAGIPALLSAQTSSVAKKKFVYDFPDMVNKAVPGSPVLSQPVLVKGSTGPVKGEGMGWADPVLFDWNKDGKKDLLIGEFYTGMEVPNRPAGKLGSNIRVYLNEGSESSPKFSDAFEYAKDKTGARLNVDAFCCIGFTPRFHDLNGDGNTDIITGSFAGHVTCYYGSKDGFLPPIDLEQKGFGPGKEASIAGMNLPVTDPQSLWYWSYSSADFVDVDGDGLLDLITGGGALRVSRNTGTKTHPSFDTRELLLDIKGQPLAVCVPDKKVAFREVAGVYSAVPLVTDWDKDGVPDLLVTSDYEDNSQPAVSFFRGVRINKTLRFESPVSLFDAGDGSKQFPGTWLRTWVTDWNNDGINDLLIGTSIATSGNSEFDPYFSWEWERESGIVKNNPRFAPDNIRQMVETAQPQYLKDLVDKGKIKEEEKAAYGKRYMSLAHQGYVYVLLGKGTYKK